MRLGIGDDAALVGVTRGRELILKSDMSIERVHFTRRLHPPRAVGHRALARSLSDIAAMGGTPRFALVSLALSKRAPRGWLEEFYAGLLALARSLGVAVVGGDTALVEGPTFVDAVVAGEVEAGKGLRRSGARPGDRIYVSGRLGLSALGLRLLKTRSAGLQPGMCHPEGRGYIRPGALEDEAIRAHLYPQPRLQLGRFLLRHALASAAMDLSDGLSTDLARLAEASGVGACLWAERIPCAEVAPPSTRDARRHARALELALHGGEDYELLFTVPTAKTPRLPTRHRGLPLHAIGEITKSKGIALLTADGNRTLLDPGGYDHFEKQ